MSNPPSSEVTTLLAAARAGDRRAADDLLPLVYQNLRRLAESRMKSEPAGHTLSATALVHEAYLRLVADDDEGWATRGHFFGAAAEAMRRILIERARAKKAIKRGGDRRREPLADLAIECDISDEDLLALDNALQQLVTADPRAYGVVMLRYFGGLTVPQIAEATGSSRRNVDRDWRCARLWLLEQIDGQSNER